MRITVTMDKSLTGVVAKYQGAATRNIGKHLMKAATYTGGKISESVYRNFPGGKGDLARSFMPALLVATGKRLSAGAFSTKKHARILDQGGTILPKTVQKLAIPLSNKAKDLWPRDWGDGLFMLVSRKGNALLVERKGKGKLEIHYVLKSSVDIHPRHYLPEAGDAARPGVVSIISKGIAADLKAAEGRKK